MIYYEIIDILPRQYSYHHRLATLRFHLYQAQIRRQREGLQCSTHWVQSTFCNPRTLTQEVPTTQYHNTRGRSMLLRVSKALPTVHCHRGTL